MGTEESRSTRRSDEAQAEDSEQIVFQRVNRAWRRPRTEHASFIYTQQCLVPVGIP